jgi:hypothetical protein
MSSLPYGPTMRSASPREAAPDEARLRSRSGRNETERVYKDLVDFASSHYERAFERGALVVCDDPSTQTRSQV